MKNKKTFWLWLLSFLLTIILAVYQRLSGPTFPISGKETLAGTRISYKFYRSWTSNKKLPVRITIGSDIFSAQLYYRRYPLLDSENWTVSSMMKNGHVFTAAIPSKPPAGKVIYKVRIYSKTGDLWLKQGQPVVARFKGEVPSALLIVHMVFMFAGLLLGIRTGLETLNKNGKYKTLVFLALAAVFFGGLILGPLVQYYAFGTLWSGFPIGGDLTDSKTALIVILWILAFFLQKKSRWWIIAAILLMIAVYLVPHSVLGSEYNYKTGKIETAARIGSASTK